MPYKIYPYKPAFEHRTSTGRPRTKKRYCSLRLDVRYKIQWSKISIDPCAMNQRPSYKTDIEDPVMNLLSSIEHLRVNLEPRKSTVLFVSTSATRFNGQKLGCALRHALWTVFRCDITIIIRYNLINLNFFRIINLIWLQTILNLLNYIWW